MSTWPHFTLDDYAQLAQARDRCAGADMSSEIDARFIRGPLDGKHQPLPQAYREYLFPVPQDPMRSLSASGLPVMPVHVYRLLSVRPDGLHTYIYEGTRDT